MRFDLGTLDSGERSLPFGLLVCCSYSLDTKVFFGDSSGLIANFNFADRSAKFLQISVFLNLCQLILTAMESSSPISDGYVFSYYH